jgi:integrase
VKRHRNDNVRKVCACARRNWPSCRHAWYLNYKPRHASPPADWLATPGRNGLPRDPKSWPGYRLSLNAHFGRPITNKTDAEALAEALKIEIRDGRFGVVPTTPPTPAAFTLDELMRRYQAEGFTARVWNPAATPGERSQIAVTLATEVPDAAGDTRRFGDFHVRPVGERDPLAITAPTLERLRAVRLARVEGTDSKGRKKRRGGLHTTNRSLALVRAAYNWAIRADLLTDSPFKKGTATAVRVLQEPARERRLYDGEEAALLAASGPHLYAVIVALLDTGCRIGELLSLQWHQVTLDGKERSITLPAGKTKTKRARSIPITTRLAAVLDMRRLDAAGKRHAPRAYVFGRETGERITSVKTAWKLACKRASITDLHVHDLRREAASRWADTPVPLSEVQKWLGHARVSQTATYVQARVGHGHVYMAQAEAAARLQAFAKESETGGQPVSLKAANVNTSPQDSSASHDVH